MNRLVYLGYSQTHGYLDSCLTKKPTGYGWPLFWKAASLESPVHLAGHLTASTPATTSVACLHKPSERPHDFLVSLLKLLYPSMKKGIQLPLSLTETDSCQFRAWFDRNGTALGWGRGTIGHSLPVRLPQCCGDNWLCLALETSGDKLGWTRGLCSCGIFFLKLPRP